MIICKLTGGLGNQMFQYARARAASLRLGLDLSFDKSQYERGSNRQSKYTPREFGLDGFEVDFTFRKIDEVVWEDPLVIVLNDMPDAVPRDQLTFSPSGNVSIIMRGNWQSARYFEDYADTIRSDFAFRSPAHPKWAERIAAEEDSVCVHVRRTDYLHLAGRHLGFLRVPYYRKSFAYMRDNLRKPHFFIFSDDLTWCRKYLKLDKCCSYIEYTADHEPHAAYDLQLMTLCKYFIIANSTYSWWAAWLGADPHKVVVSPDRWFQGIEGRVQNPTLADWIKVGVVS
jgi:hypothetical protein